MNYRDNILMTGQPEYDKDFWSFMKGSEIAKNRLNKGYITDVGAYLMPNTTDGKYEKSIAKESLFRGLASVFTCYGGPESIFAIDCDDIAEYVGEFESINVKNIADDFTRIPVGFKKIATILRMSTEFATDASFDLESYLTRCLAKTFARAEDQSFLLGDSVNEPTGILGNRGGAEVGVQTDSITYDDVISLFFSVKPEYRKNAVWMMNDTAAMALRKLKDADGNYLWNNADNTILGKRVEISEYMPDASAGAKPIAFGDFSYYWIIKRCPVTVKMLKELFAVRGQIGYLAFEFLDGKLIRQEAVKVIQIVEG